MINLSLNSCFWRMLIADKETTGVGLTSTHSSGVVITEAGFTGLEFASFNRSGDEDDELLEIALRKLPETQFSRLSSNTSASFGFDVIPINIGLRKIYSRYLMVAGFSSEGPLQFFGWPFCFSFTSPFPHSAQVLS